ncbi:hypothetical protein ACHAQA_006850 [Verticillium albo-atrum]
MSSPKRVLFLTNAERGQANVFLAVSQELAHLNPSLELHLCSFAPLAKPVAALSAPITFHELKGTTWQNALFNRPEHHFLEYTSKKPTVWNAAEAATIMPRIACPWNHDEMSNMVRQIQSLIKDINPDLVVIDNLLTPAVTVCYPMTTPKWTVLSPNTYKEFILANQPSLAVLWKYPPPRSTMLYPVPFYQIPSVTYQILRYALNIRSPWVHGHAVNLKTNNDIEFSDWGRLTIPPPGLKVILPSRPDIDFPFSLIPDHIKSCGPIVLPAPPVQEADPALADWLARCPTVYVNLGTHASYDANEAAQLASALKLVLEEAEKRGEKLQVLWKLKKKVAIEGKPEAGYEGIEEVLGGLAERVRVVDWLDAEPISILESGKVVCSVHHGGANSYFEAVSTGVPQVVLPVWYDTYDFAQRVEWLGIGRFGNRKAAPRCAAEELGPILVDVVFGDGAVSIRAKAAGLAKACSADGGGRRVATREILDMLA